MQEAVEALRQIAAFGVEVKIVSLVIIVTALLGIVNIFVRFLFPEGSVTPLKTRVFDIILALIGLAFITVFLPPPKIIESIGWAWRWTTKGRKQRMPSPFLSDSTTP